MPLAVLRTTMDDLILETRLMISDNTGVNQQFTDLQIQNRLDESRTEIRYETLQIGPSIVNAASTNNIPSTIYADFYSQHSFWERDVVIQGNIGSNSWLVLTPVTSNYVVGHWTFEANIFTAGTVPGQPPPVFATGKVYDCYAAAANLLEFWAVTLTNQFDFTSDSQSFKVSQLMTNKMAMAKYYKQQAKPRTATMNRVDVQPPFSTRQVRLLDTDDSMKGV